MNYNELEKQCDDFDENTKEVEGTPERSKEDLQREINDLIGLVEFQDTIIQSLVESLRNRG